MFHLFYLLTCTTSWEVPLNCENLSWFYLSPSRFPPPFHSCILISRMYFLLFSCLLSSFLSSLFLFFSSFFSVLLFLSFSLIFFLFFSFSYFPLFCKKNPWESFWVGEAPTLWSRHCLFMLKFFHSVMPHVDLLYNILQTRDINVNTVGVKLDAFIRSIEHAMGQCLHYIRQWGWGCRTTSTETTKDRWRCQSCLQGSMWYHTCASEWPLQGYIHTYITYIHNICIALLHLDRSASCTPKCPATSQSQEVPRTSIGHFLWRNLSSSLSFTGW